MIAIKIFCLVLIVAFCSCDARTVSRFEFEDEAENNQLSESWSAEADELVKMDDYQNYNRVYNGYSYIYHPGKMSHYHAEKYCTSLGGDLAWHNMLTPDGRKKVLGLFHGINVWLGVRYAFGSWRTQAMTPITHHSFGWNTGEPNYMRTEQCSENWEKTLYVNNIPCWDYHSVLCEVKINKE